ncbi:hypothetical protein U0070_016618 [Myodes glareolus]|uniref:Uncharacterized protein n=1 Tax=Myodes glareolus TaxID=447135 RepID=A0AAW0HWS1_MYOGA
MGKYSWELLPGAPGMFAIMESHQVHRVQSRGFLRKVSVVTSYSLLPRVWLQLK